MGQSYSRGYLNKYPENSRIGVWKPQDVFFKQLERTWSSKVLELKPILFLDSNNLNSITLDTNGRVTNWLDLANNVNFVKNGSGNCTLTQINGKTYINNPADSSFSASYPLSIPTMSVFCVASFASTSGAFGKISFLTKTGLTSFGSNQLMINFERKNTASTMDVIRNNDPRITTSALTYNQLYLFYNYTNFTKLGAYLNGTLVSEISRTYNTNIDFEAFVLGLGIVGLFSKLVVFDRELPLNQRQLLEATLMWETNLQASLPSQHPYKNYSPL